MSNNAHDLCNRLLNALDSNYNVVDMQAVNEIISILENFNITKELLETTRLGKHVNNMRRKTDDATLARRAKELVKRWRDLVIPTHASPAHTSSNRSSAERQVRRLGGTPLTSPALSRVVSPAVASPKSSSRPAWGGYESDSQDVILVDDEPAPPPAALPAPLPRAPAAQPGKRGLTPEAVADGKRAKRDKKPKKKRGHSRAGSGSTTLAGAAAVGSVPPVPPGPQPPGPQPPGPQPPGPQPAVSPAPWPTRNGAHPATERRKNGCRKNALDPYAALVNKIPHPGAKKVKTTKELLEQIQSRGSKPVPSPGSTGSHDDDVVVVEDVYPLIKVESPLRNGGSPRPVTPKVERSISPWRAPILPLEDARELAECTCGEEAEDGCPAAGRTSVAPYHVVALHNVYLPGVNGTRAPTEAHQFAVRKAADPERDGLFASVVPLYRYSDYADDYCVKNMWRVPLCPHLPSDQFAPPPPDPPPCTPPWREPSPELSDSVVKSEPCDTDTDKVDSIPCDVDVKLSSERRVDYNCKIEAEMVSVPTLEPSERLKGPILSTEEARQFGAPPEVATVPEREFKTEPLEHRTVERTKEDIDGRTLVALCERALKSVPYNYEQCASAPVVTLPLGPEAETAVAEALRDAPTDQRDALGRPPRSEHFTEWHESARLGHLIALPYVVID